MPFMRTLPLCVLLQYFTPQHHTTVYSTSFFLSRPTDKWTSRHHACTERQEDRQNDKKVYWLTLTNLYTFLFYFKHNNYSTTVPLHQWKTYKHRHKSLNMQQDWKTEQGICGMESRSCNNKAMVSINDDSKAKIIIMNRKQMGEVNGFKYPGNHPV